MCGLAGYFGEAGEPDALLRSMVGTLIHRGPDGQGSFMQPSRGGMPGVGLSHVRLSIVGLDDNAQPMTASDGMLAIAFNGEIFNYVELRDELRARGHVFRTSGDTEVILHLYQEMGEACLSRLNGDFAFAIWDGRRQRLMLARDQMGVRPLFFCEHRGTLFFASEIKALLRVPGIGGTLDPFALDQIFTLWAPIAPRTAFTGIQELEPGCIMLADAHGRRVSTYWQAPAITAEDAPVEPRNLADIIGLQRPDEAHVCAPANRATATRGCPKASRRDSTLS